MFLYNSISVANETNGTNENNEFKSLYVIRRNYLMKYIIVTNLHIILCSY